MPEANPVENQSPEQQNGINLPQELILPYIKRLTAAKNQAQDQVIYLDSLAEYWKNQFEALQKVADGLVNENNSLKETLEKMESKTKKLDNELSEPRLN